MGLFDSIIGTANDEAEPLEMTTIVEETAVPVDNILDDIDMMVTGDDALATGGGSGGGTSDGSGSGDGSGGGTGGGSGGGTGDGSGDGSGGGSGYATDTIPDIDIGDIGLEFFEGQESVDLPGISVSESTPITTSESYDPMGTPVEESMVAAEESVADTPEVEASPLFTESDVSNSFVIVPEMDTASLQYQDVLLDANGVACPIECRVPVKNKNENFDERVTEFVSELEELKANDMTLLQQKQAEVARLEAEASEIEKEIKKIQAEEKKIDTAIGSLTGKTK